MRRTPLTALLATLLLTATGLAAVPGTATAAAPRGSVVWEPCVEEGADLPDRLVCATLTVPVDWARPRGATFELALAKLPAADPARRIGPLFVNPGGPGGSGVNMVYGAEETFSAELTDRFDIVSFDPRGQARSRPVLCDLDHVVAQDALLFPRGSAEYRRLRAANRTLAEGCRDLTGPLVGEVDTASVVRDMDAVRAAIGEPRISYYGVSYGTMIGQQYAELFPKRLRALVLDSNMDHSQDIWSYQKWEAVAMEESFLQFAAWCDRTPACALHGEDVPAYYDELYAKAEAGALEVTTTDLTWWIFGSMYDPVAWFQLAADLRDAGAGRGEPVELGYRPVMCLDFHFDVGSYGRVAGIEKALRKYAPHTRLNPLAWTDLTGCQNWPGRVTNPPHRLQASPALPPILITNSRYDVATPYQWGRDLARQLPSATFLTYDGVGHGDYWLSPCARAAIDTYLLTRVTPPRGTHCPAIYPTEPPAARRSTATPIRPFTR